MSVYPSQVKDLVYRRSAACFLVTVAIINTGIHRDANTNICTIELSYILAFTAIETFIHKSY